MGTTTTLLTVQEFLALPEIEGECLELIGGELVSMPMSGYPHEVTKSNLNRLLTAWSLQNPALRVFCEAAYQLTERNCLIPDISLIASGRLVPGTTGVFQSAPELAIEVVSSEPAARLERKIRLYLAHGGKSVWAIYPQERVVRIDSASGAKKFLDDRPLVDPVLPGFSIPTSAIFEGV
ncbi:MAG: Uma2 family endonuclease [Bryobacteraceae bacterium]|jgi:Uma2 family endonuclease